MDRVNQMVSEYQVATAPLGSARARSSVPASVAMVAMVALAVVAFGIGAGLSSDGNGSADTQASPAQPAVVVMAAAETISLADVPPAGGVDVASATAIARLVLGAGTAGVASAELVRFRDSGAWPVGQPPDAWVWVISAWDLGAGHEIGPAVLERVVIDQATGTIVATGFVMYPSASPEA